MKIKKNAREMKLDKMDLFGLGEILYNYNPKVEDGELVCNIVCSTATKDIVRMLANKALKCYGKRYKVIEAYDLGYGASVIVTNLCHEDMFEYERPKEKADIPDDLSDLDGESYLEHISNELDI